MSGWMFLGFVTIICLGLFLTGRRYARMSPEKLEQAGLISPGKAMTLERIRRNARLFMIWAPLFWVVVAAACFGLFGPIRGFQTLSLHGGIGR